MNEADSNGRRPYAAGLTEQRERDLDRMLDLLAPPAPSDTLRARLKRDFDAPGAASAATAASMHKRFVLRGQWGGVAVAASLVLAVALGVVAPPETSGPREEMSAAVYGSETAGAEMTDAELLAASAADSPLYMVVTYNATVTDDAEVSDTVTSASGPVSRVSYTEFGAVDAVYDSDVFGTMPLE